MRVETYFNHHGLVQNPFDAEEARHDPVFERLTDDSPGHPDFAKIFGQIDNPTTSVVFGEKGSGKTAIRLLIGRRIDAHNAQNPDQRMLLVAYDDLDPLIDRVVSHQRSYGVSRAGRSEERLLESIRLEDHQDAILSLAVTQLVDWMVQSDDRATPNRSNKSPAPGRSAVPPGKDASRPAAIALPRRRVRKIPRRARVDLAVLAALYDQPLSGTAQSRWSNLCSKLRLRRLPAMAILSITAIAVTLTAAGLLIAGFVALQMQGDQAATGLGTVWLYPSGSVLAALSVILWAAWCTRHVKLWRLVRKIHKQMPAIERSRGELKVMLLQLRRSDLAGQPWPVGGVDSRKCRYELTSQLLRVLESLGFAGVLVLVDRVDEPTLVGGDAERMRRIVWPMLDNKFLQQNRVGVKLLLPIELRHMLLRETAQFFQEARLDKQNLIDRLVWSGSMLYDLCSARFRACRRAATEGGDGSKTDASLMDLFDQDVSRDLIADALDAMQQPRDAFKFLYSVIQEHCRLVADDQPVYRISRVTVETVRRNQAQRVQDFQRGLGPG